MIPPDDLDERLAALAARTEAVRPTAGFSARVLAAVHAEQPGVLDFVVSASRRVIPMVVAFTLAAIGLAALTEQTTDETLAASYGQVEMEW